MADESICRLDLLLVERGFFRSREKSKHAIGEGRVFVGGKCVKKVSSKVPMSADIAVAPAKEYASRGAYKLQKALEVFGIDLQGKVCADIGASTGGFTHIMLEHGAARVYAIDVGKEQLASFLREDERVVVLEKTDIRSVNMAHFVPLPEFCAVDLSFISLALVLENIAKLRPKDLIALIKPQFELSKADIGKRGIVKDKNAHIRAIRRVLEVAKKLNLKTCGLIPSPIKGKDGNIEYLIWFSETGTDIQVDEVQVVVKAFG